MPKTSKRDTLSIYIRITKLGLLGCYFLFGSNWTFCQIEENYKKLGLFGIVRMILPILNDRKDSWKIRIILGI